MVQLIDHRQLNALNEQLTTLTKRCEAWDKQITLSENKAFRFEVHLFQKSSLTLLGYCQQIQSTLAQLNYAVKRDMDKLIINHECESFVNQFSAILNIVNHLDEGNAEVLYKRYSSQQEVVYQHLQRQYEYEKRLLAMIDEENTRYQKATQENKLNHKLRVNALKERYQKCNEYTQSLEFKMEALNNE